MSNRGEICAILIAFCVVSCRTTTGSNSNLKNSTPAGESSDVFQVDPLELNNEVGFQVIFPETASKKISRKLNTLKELTTKDRKYALICESESKCKLQVLMTSVRFVHGKRYHPEDGLDVMVDYSEARKRTFHSYAVEIDGDNAQAMNNSLSKQMQPENINLRGNKGSGYILFSFDGFLAKFGADESGSKDEANTYFICLNKQNDLDASCTFEFTYSQKITQ